MTKRKSTTVLESEMGAVDLTESQETPPAAPQEPEQAPKPVPVASPCHPLESAPINSKIVVTADGAVLAFPEGEPLTLVRPDPSARLPVGAKITKVESSEGETLYVATLLNSERPETPTYHDSALEAIQNFAEAHYNR